MKIGILGGSFSPPHKGHIHAALEAKMSLGLDRVILIPAGDPPHKVLPEGTPDKIHRLNMARIAAESMGAEVSDIEINRDGKSYTADTLGKLSKAFPKDKLYLIMGTDMFLSIDTWYMPQVIFNLASIVAVARNQGDLTRILEKEAALTKLGAEVFVIKCEAYPMSSTRVREDISGLKDALPEGVWDYIVRENLYGISGENT